MAVEADLGDDDLGRAFICMLCFSQEPHEFACQAARGLAALRIEPEARPVERAEQHQSKRVPVGACGQGQGGHQLAEHLLVAGAQRAQPFGHRRHVLGQHADQHLRVVAALEHGLQVRQAGAFEPHPGFGVRASGLRARRPPARRRRLRRRRPAVLPSTRSGSRPSPAASSRPARCRALRSRHSRAARTGSRPRPAGLAGGCRSGECAAGGRT
jgi:hypothetical protein